jgi:radical SAM superfamily enzyme YgiQ (UPF0313 family)
MLSIPSSFAFAWAQRFCKTIRNLKPDLKIVVGGKWAVGTDGNWVKHKIPQIDLVVYGDAEHRIEALAHHENWTTVPYTSESRAAAPEPPLVEFPSLDYSLMPDFEQHQPIIEVSRGCGLGRAFCLEKDVPLGSLMAPSRIRDVLLAYYDLYGSRELNSYFQSSFFRPSTKWAEEMANTHKKHGLSTEWRTETRVDSLSPKQLGALSRAGLKIVDLGLESASPRQLLAMEKTSQPAVYLKRAGELLKACSEFGI